MSPQHGWSKPSCFQSATHTESMNRFVINSSSSTSAYFWSECDSYEDDDDGGGKSGRPSAGILILHFTYCFEFLVGAPSNLWLVCHILWKRSKVAGVLPADFFPLHLAVTQLSFNLAMPAFFANHLLWHSNNVLAVVSLLTSLVLVMKPLLLCLVCVERYMAVVRPHDYLRFKARRYRWGCLGASWCIYFIMASVAFVKRSAITLCVVFLPVLVVDTFCSLSVLKTLKRAPPGDRMVMEEKKKKKGEVEIIRSGVVRMEEGEQSGSKEGKREDKAKEAGRSELRGKGEMNSMKKKAFITIIIIQAVLTLNYLPMIIIVPMDGLVPARTLKCQYQVMALAAATSCGYLQPLLYLHRLGRLPCTTSQNT